MATSLIFGAHFLNAYLKIRRDPKPDSTDNTSKSDINGDDSLGNAVIVQERPKDLHAP